MWGAWPPLVLSTISGVRYKYCPLQRRNQVSAGKLDPYHTASPWQRRTWTQVGLIQGPCSPPLPLPGITPGLIWKRCAVSHGPSESLIIRGPSITPCGQPLLDPVEESSVLLPLLLLNPKANWGEMGEYPCMGPPSAVVLGLG